MAASSPDGAALDSRPRLEPVPSTSKGIQDDGNATVPPPGSISTENSGDGYDESARGRPQYAPIQQHSTYRSEKYRDDGLEKTVSQVLGGIKDEDRERLRQIASLHRSKTGTTEPADLERKDTLASVTDEDPRLDPESPEFDIYIWARAFTRAADEVGLKYAKSGFVFKNLKVSGTGSALSVQQDFSTPFMVPFRLGEYLNTGARTPKTILRNFNGIVKSGEMLIVLGRPGSGCSTFLKTICGELSGLEIDKVSEVHYDGIPHSKMVKQFKGEVVYNQEVDKHFPHLTVGETLEFATAARTPHSRVRGISREEYVKHLTQVMMTVLGLAHTRNTKVGNDFIRGVSGGERKRVSIAEMALASSRIACWDNSTRGLDSATALEFVRGIRIASDVSGVSNAVAIYQASQAIFDIFDKALVLYEGRQIFFGPIETAKRYFEDMGWLCPPRQTTGDFLTSVTNPQERKARAGFESKVPRTPDEFEAYWQRSEAYANTLTEIEEHEAGLGDENLGAMREAHHQMQSEHLRPNSPFLISPYMQVRLCMKRAYQRLWNDKVSTITTVVGQIVMALVVGSVFYGTPVTTASFFSKGSVLFFAILLNALISITEINSLYSQRPIVEKHASYAFYHPWTEAFAGVISDVPVKFLIAVCFNVILYFLAGLRTEPSQFFIFFLFVFVSMLTMSSIFRCLAAVTSALSQAMALAGVMVLAIVIYTGFTLPRPYEHPWMKWISWINPIAYAFEAILVNEVHGRRFPCANLVPSPQFQSGSSFICSVAGAVPGVNDVLGDDWVKSSYGYSYTHIWRNLGFLFAFQIFFLALYLVATELNSSTSSSAEVLLFRRGHAPRFAAPVAKGDVEASSEEQISAESSGLQDAEPTKIGKLAPQRDVFTWRNVVYDITIKGEPRRLLDHVSGWVKPGTLTALMGVSGAGKTTLLDALAQRTSTGIITGDMFVNGRPLDSSFQRKTGYVQQQDLHLETSTVREALRFSALLRQPPSVSKKEKYDFVEEVIDMLNMREFSEAVVGVPGEGLNVEQRKLLTIGVELAAKPALLIFLDEPTSGLDSQSSWAIVAFLRRLADRGQAVLSTIHQPSSILFQEFDRLLFLAKGGRTVYFGEIGENSRTLLDYFENNGARKCTDDENPAEYMLEAVGAGASGKSTLDWPDIWNKSPESQAVQIELDNVHREKASEGDDGQYAGENHGEFAMPFLAQLQHVTVRVFQQYYRTPSYLWGKLMLGVMSALFIGFSFYKQKSSQQGLQNVIFSVFMLTAIFSTLVQQIMPRFVLQRDLYEVRERPSKAYSWKAFIIANIFVEIPWQMLLGILAFASYYYPIYGRHQSSERQGLILLFCMQFFVFASTFAHMLIAALPDAETAGNIATLMFSLSLVFNGVMQPPQALPGFWIFMYRVSPLTYLVDGIAGTGMHARAVECASNEFSRFDPPAGQTCGGYLEGYLTANPGGILTNPDATTNCEYCTLSTSDQFLAGVAIGYDTRWRNYGIGFAYITFNIAAAILFYYLFRVRKWSGASTKKSLSNAVHGVQTCLFGLRTVLVGHGKAIPKPGQKEDAWPNRNRIY